MENIEREDLRILLDAAQSWADDLGTRLDPELEKAADGLDALVARLRRDHGLRTPSPDLQALLKGLRGR